MEITPWEVKGKIDYDRIIKNFGLSYLKNLPKKFNDSLLFRRKIIFAHRDFNRILYAIKNREKFVMMTGLMPFGKFHLGHMILAKQMTFYQSLGAKVYVAVADIEAYNTRKLNIKELRNNAIEEYLINYIALGLKSKNCDFYFQSARSKNAKKTNAYYKLVATFSRYITFNEIKAIYGNISPAKMFSALLQASDMFHPQLQEFENPTPTVVPVGIDQDPHIRLARDICHRYKDYNFIQLSSTYHKFFPGLKGINIKMSSSDPNSYIALTDTSEQVEKKIKNAFSGGKKSVKEHREKGGNPDIDVSYQMLKFFFEPNDKKLKEIHDDYKSGTLLTSELKEYLIKKINKFLKEHQKKRARARRYVDKFLKS